MYNLLKINSALIHAINYKAILLDTDCFHIGNYRFKWDIVNFDGTFIGTKYKKFLWFKYNTCEYEDYKYALTKPYLIGFYDGTWTQNPKEIRTLLQDAIDTGIFTEETSKLLELLNKAEVHIEKQNQILINLEKEVY